MMIFNGSLLILLGITGLYKTYFSKSKDKLICTDQLKFVSLFIILAGLFLIMMDTLK